MSISARWAAGIASVEVMYQPHGRKRTYLRLDLREAITLRKELDEVIAERQPALAGSDLELRTRDFLAATERVELVEAVLREAQAENERLRGFLVRAQARLMLDVGAARYVEGNVALVEEIEAALAPADEAKPE